MKTYSSLDLLYLNEPLQRLSLKVDIDVSIKKSEFSMQTPPFVCVGR